ncbi:MAG: hypothetical protein WC516_06525 [Patescibacteria group bacterium]
MFSKITDVENVMANDMRDYFINKIKFASLYPGVNLKISTDHPFVSLMQQTVPESGVFDLTGLFPAITVIDTNSAKLIDSMVAPGYGTIPIGILADIETYKRDKYIISKEDLTRLIAAFEGKTELIGLGVETQKKVSITIEIWALNNAMKGKIYDLISLYLVNRMIYLRENYEIMLDEASINGERSGTYNFDFGETLYGSMLRFTCGVVASMWEIVDIDNLASVDVSVNGLI